MRYRTIGTGAAQRRVSALCLGAMKLGGNVDDSTSFAILDRFLEAGGTFIDTSNNYRFWEPGCTPDDSEKLLGRWRAARGDDLPEELVIATKFGARPNIPGGGVESWEGLSRSSVQAAAEGSCKRLGVDHLDLYYPHVEDRSVPLEETLDALSALVDSGKVGLLGASNHAAWRLERARGLAESGGRHRYQVLQLRYSYLRPRADLPLPEGGHVHATPEHLDFVREENAAGRDTAMVAYTPLLMGAYTRDDKKLSRPYDHPGVPARMAALDDVVAHTGATRNQVVLAWMIDHNPPVIPLVGVSTIAQLDEAMEAADLHLTDDQRRILDAAG